MEPTPDLTNYFDIHHGMRADSRRYVAAVAAAAPEERSGRLRALARWAQGFGHELHLHHTVEDDVIFPDLASRVATVRPVLADLEADHVTVARLLERWPVAAAQLADPRHPFTERKAEVLDLAVELRDLLARHLDVEDIDVLPLFYRHYTAAEYEALDRRAMASVPKRGLSFSVPWNVAQHDAQRQAELLAAAPLPLRLVHRLSKGRYRRLVDAAFAGIPVPQPA